MKFLKAEGLGNDFIITHGLNINEFSSVIENTPKLCDRRRGIGADGIIFVLPPSTATADFRMKILNSDGSEAEMCGNGIRCFLLYLHEMNLTNKNGIIIETLAGLTKAEYKGEDITVDMGCPILEGRQIPTTKTVGQVVKEPLKIADKEFLITAVSMGNPHCIVYNNPLTDDLINTYGPQLESHPFFPEKTNVEFINVLSKKEIQMRVFERGCGETMACGTGACASVVAGIINKKHEKSVTVHLPGGDLLIKWDGNLEHSVFMTGPANIVFSGEIYIQ